MISMRRVKLFCFCSKWQFMVQATLVIPINLHKRIISGFLLDLISKLMLPEHPLNRKSWQVDDSKLMPEQVLQVIAAEIVGDHPRL